MGELRIGAAEERELVRTGIVGDDVAAVGVTFLTDALLRRRDDTADEADLVLMLGEELRGQDLLLVRLRRQFLFDTYLGVLACIGSAP